MKTVYVLLEGADYEGHEVRGCYDSMEGAMAAMKSWDGTPDSFQIVSIPLNGPSSRNYAAWGASTSLEFTRDFRQDEVVYVTNRLFGNWELSMEIDT